MGSQREWWLLKYAETGRSLSTREKKGGKKKIEDPVKQTCLGVSLPYMETCVKLGRNLSMTSPCSVAAAGSVSNFQAKVHVNVPADRVAPWCKIHNCFPLLHPSKLVTVIMSSHLHKDACV